MGRKDGADGEEEADEVEGDEEAELVTVVLVVDSTLAIVALTSFVLSPIWTVQGSAGSGSGRMYSVVPPCILLSICCRGRLCSKGSGIPLSSST